MRSLIPVILIILALIPTNILAWDFYAGLVRDNINYSGFYSVDLYRLSLAESYQLYRQHVGASEPIYFLYSYLFSISGFKFEYSILVLNFLFSSTIVLFSLKINMSKLKVVIFCVFLCFNYYFFVLFSELHRLLLGFIFITLSFCTVSPRLRLVLFSLSVLSHLQMLFLLPLYLKWRLDKKLVLSLAFLLVFVLLFFDALAGKVTYHLNLSLMRGYYNDVLLTGVYTGILSTIYYLMGKKLKLEEVFFLMCVTFGVLMFGASRLNILIYLMFYFWMFNNVRINSSIIFIIFLLPLIFISMYDVKRIYVQYDSLVSGGVR